MKILSERQKSFSLEMGITTELNTKSLGHYICKYTKRAGI